MIPKIKLGISQLLISTALLTGSAGFNSAFAEDMKLSGSVSAEYAFFPHEGVNPGQLSGGQASLAFALTGKWRSQDKKTRTKFNITGRADESDHDRNSFEIREAYLRHKVDNFSILAGVNKVFWGVTESRHLVDIINQVDNLEYTDSDARLGQPMVMLTANQEWGSLSGIVMAGFREQKFPGIDGRMRLPLPIDSNATTWEDGQEGKALDYALRYYNSFDSIDLGLSAFYGTSREAKFNLNGTDTAFIPHYSRIWQTGIDVQYTNEALLLKLEAIHRDGHEFKNFNAAVVGFEYTISQLGDGDSDLGLIGEYLYDGRGSDAPVTVQQNDIFVGARWAANDSQDTAALFGAMFDLDDETTALRAEFDTRITDGLTLDIKAQHVLNSAPQNPMYGQRHDGYISVELSKHF